MGNQEKCPRCGCETSVIGVQSNQGEVYRKNLLGGQTLYHVICLKCGSVIRSYVKKPEKLL